MYLGDMLYLRVDPGDWMLPAFILTQPLIVCLTVMAAPH